MTATATAAPVNPLVATDLRPEALAARICKEWNAAGKSTTKALHITCNAVSLWILKAEDLDRDSVSARAAAWKEIDATLMESANDAGKQVGGPMRSMFKRVVSYDIAGTYLTPWSQGDFSVSLRAAYEALGGAVARPVPTVQSILEAAAKRVAKYHPASVCVIDTTPDSLTLTVQS